MNNFRALFYAPLLFLAVGCREPKAVETAREQASKLAVRANESLAKVEAGDLSDLQAVRVPIRAIKASLAAKDFSEARELGEQIDKLMQTKFVAQSIEFLRIESTEGTEKAKAAISDYMAQHDLGEAEKKAFREVFVALDKTVEESSTEQRIDLVALVVYLACERKMSHTAIVPAHLSRIVLSEIFGTKLPPFGTEYPHLPTPMPSK